MRMRPGRNVDACRLPDHGATPTATTSATSGRYLTIILAIQQSTLNKHPTDRTPADWWVQHADVFRVEGTINVSRFEGKCIKVNVVGCSRRIALLAEFIDSPTIKEEISYVR